MTTATDLRLARERAGLTQQAVAHEARLSVSTVWKFERGGIDCRLSTVEAIRAAIERLSPECATGSKAGNGERAVRRGKS